MLLYCMCTHVCIYMRTYTCLHTHIYAPAYIRTLAYSPSHAHAVCLSLSRAQSPSLARARCTETFQGTLVQYLSLCRACAQERQRDCVRKRDRETACARETERLRAQERQRDCVCMEAFQGTLVRSSCALSEWVHDVIWEVHDVICT